MATILISCVENAQYRGWGVANGGIKLYSLWCKLLRQHGHEAFIVTYDGTAEPWLIEHPPVISLDAARGMVTQGTRFLTGWLVSDAFLELADKFYFFDAEMAYSAFDPRHHACLRRYLVQDRIAGIATHSRTIQAWYMATFGRAPHFIREWSDTDHWTPAPEKRIKGRVGYMHEGTHTQGVIEQLRAQVPDAEFIHVFGDEQRVLTELQRCDVFLGLNPGKAALWGEGCPRSPHEAMHAGAVVIAFDVRGNHEYLIDGHTGHIVPNGDVQKMGDILRNVLANDTHREQVRANASAFMAGAFAPTEARYNEIARFLDL